ncbi:MAG: hypothetical protein KF888_00585 [Nitrosomonas sp.]|nr:hypothetical protein [Nitrosomonas sp.]
MNAIFNSILLVICVFIAGCTATNTHQPLVIYTEQSDQNNESDHVNSLDELMRYHDSLLEKKNPHLTEEYSYAVDNYKDSLSAEDRFKYILLISIPNTTHTDLRAALDLLNNWPQEVNLPPNLADFRKFLIRMLTERQTARSNTKILLQKLNASEAQTQTLQKRIDAIINMEKDLIRRKTPNQP